MGDVYILKSEMDLRVEQFMHLSIVPYLDKIVLYLIVKNSRYLEKYDCYVTTISKGILSQIVPCSTQTLNKSIERLEKMGLIEYRYDPKREDIKEPFFYLFQYQLREVTVNHEF